MTITDSIIIDAPLKKIWQTFTDLTCWTNWNTVIRNVDSKENAIAHGCSIRCSFRPFFFPIRVKIRIEQVVPYKSVTWSARKKGLTARHEFLFQLHNDAVMVISRETFSGVLTKAYGVFLPKKKIAHLKKTFLKDLKQASEASKETSAESM